MKIFTFTIAICFVVSSFASTYYWVGGSGNWSDFANHWATSSGGNIFQTQVPSSLDDVIFDANSFSASGQTVTVDQTIAYCKNMDWTGVTNNPSFTCISSTTKIKIYGSLALSQGMNIPFNGIISFEALTLGNTITSNNQTLLCQIEFNGFGGEWSLLDSLATTGGITLSFGNLITNNYNINCGGITTGTQAPGSLLLGTSTVTCGEWVFGDTSTVLDADSSYIKVYGSRFWHETWNNTFQYNIVELNTYGLPEFSGINANFKKVIFRTGGAIRRPSTTIDSLLCYGNLDSWSGFSGLPIVINYAQVSGNFSIMTHKLICNVLSVTGNGNFNHSSSEPSNIIWAYFGGNLTISQYDSVNQFGKCIIMGDGNFLSNNNNFDTLKLNIGRTYTFASNTTQNINQWFDCFGNPGFPIQLVSNNVGQQATLNIGQNMFCSDYLYMRDMNGTGSPNLYAGANSNNVFNNTGWIFSNCVIAVDELSSDENVFAYPNPFSASAEIYIANLQEVQMEKVILKIYDVYGKEIHPSVIRNPSSLIISRNDMSRGVYFYELFSNEKRIGKGMLIAD